MWGRLFNLRPIGNRPAASATKNRVIMVMVDDESPHVASRAPNLDGSWPVVNYIYVENVGAVIQRAVAAGAKVPIPAANQFLGDRMGRIIDPAGHVWNVATRVEEESSD
jgi:PhnB protein